jgi:hypothetical protein
MPAPELDLDARPRAAAKAAKPKKEVVEEAPLELAVDPRSIMQERSQEAAAPVPIPPIHLGARPGPPAPLTATSSSRSQPSSLAPPAADLETDARMLADYGDPPGTPVLAPLYAWRVFKRQRELKAALAIRAAEAEHAKTALEDALVALAERIRPAAEKQPAYLVPIEELTRAEDLLRSRDKVLAAEQDAQRARLAQVDVRISRAEQELAQAQGHERAVATELSGAQGALAREEAKIKRAEAELRAAQQRESPGGAGPR